MKTPIAAALFGAVLLAGGAAVAQNAPPAPPGPPPGPPPAPEAGPPPGGPDGGPGFHHGPPPFMRRMMMERMMHRPEPTKAAVFHFRKGDARVDIKCADDEPTKACVDAATTLMDKLAAQPK